MRKNACGVSDGARFVTVFIVGRGKDVSRKSARRNRAHEPAQPPRDKGKR